jgi:stalled ribosome alternative rescue factor ArfA
MSQRIEKKKRGQWQRQKEQTAADKYTKVADE